MKWMKCNKRMILSIVSISSVIIAINDLFITSYLNNRPFKMIGNLCDQLINVYPESEQDILEILKSNNLYQNLDEKRNVLINYGYSSTDFGDDTVILTISVLWTDRKNK